MRNRGTRWFPMAFLALGLAGCIPVEGGPPRIPPIPAERLPSPPASTVTLIWQPGHYDWDGTNYVFVRGVWVPRGGHGPLWQDGSWRRGSGGWEWVPAHWL